MEPKLIEIRGVGSSTAEALTDQGLARVSDIAEAGVEKIAGIPGFGRLRAAEVIAAAAALLAATEPGEPPELAAGSSETPSKTKGKHKKNPDDGKHKKEKDRKSSKKDKKKKKNKKHKKHKKSKKKK